jgi:hypothetical protein
LKSSYIAANEDRDVVVIADVGVLDRRPVWSHGRDVLRIARDEVAVGRQVHLRHGFGQPAACRLSVVLDLRRVIGRREIGR